MYTPIIIIIIITFCLPQHCKTALRLMSPPPSQSYVDSFSITSLPGSVTELQQ